MASADPFVTLDRIVRKYRREVHQLAGPATADAISALEAHLRKRLPPGLRGFLARHNGADLFRGALRLRSTSEIAPADDEAPHVFVFGDGHDGTRWAWGRFPDGRHAFGTWDGEHLHPQHATFGGWLHATLEVLDARVVRAEDQAALRLEAAPDDAYQLFEAGRAALAAGRPEEARPRLERATQVDPSHVAAWQRLGDAFALHDRVNARRAWLRALQELKLPLAFPGAPTLDPEVFPALARSFGEPEAWERELERFLEERVHEIRTLAEFQLLTAAGIALADSLAQRGRRTRAREVLSRLVHRATLFEVGEVPWDALLRLTDLDLALGHHDEAEGHLRRIRLHGPPLAHGRPLQAQALVRLARLVVMREEPWAEEILEEAAREAGEDDDLRIEIALLAAERAVRQDQLQGAGHHVARARERVERGAPRRLRAHTALVEGDVARVGGDPEAARDRYHRGLDILGDRSRSELALRLTLRLGDLARDAGQLDDARRHYRAAADGFAAQELPLREGWALVRLGQLDAATGRDPSTFFDSARARFLEADLAAGVAVVDSLARRPEASLSWHLDRATDHARARYDAQRARPPWIRADADRPERRLGAHRMAIAACGDSVVDALTVELEAAARGIRAGRGRPLDPPVLRYVAAVDLLAGHRSYKAAQVLLRHLLQGLVDGAARRALQGAVARSPNAALVDGLLQCVERPDGHPAPAVAASAEVLGMRREPESVGPLRALARPGSRPLPRRAAIGALGRIGRRDVVDHLVDALDEPALAESAALSLLMLGDRRGIDFHARALHEQRRDLSGHPGEIVGRYGGPAHLLVLATAATAESDDVALGALQGLGLLGDPRGVPTLLEAFDPRQPTRSEVAAAALEILTGHQEDVEAPGLARRWHAWWEDHGEGFSEGVRHREGRVFDVGLLLERMDGPDTWTRRTAYDELVITTGQRLPFDADGPWRVQQAHLRAWRSWWSANRSRLPAGRWFLDGRPID